MKTYLVTGGTGFIGSALVRRLVSDGHRVRVLDNNSRGAVRKLGDIATSLEIFSGDIRDAGAVREAVRGADCVCHLAYVNGTDSFYSKPDVVLDVAIRGMLNVLDASRECGVREFILASSSEVYQTPPLIPTPEGVALSVPEILNPRYSYGGGKIASELMLVNYGRNHFERAMIFRPHNVYGPDMGNEHVIPQFITRMQELSITTPHSHDVIDFPIQGSGVETRAFVYISDLIEGVALMIDRGEHLGIYHIGVDIETSIADLAHAVARCFGRKLRIVQSELRPGSPLRRCPDITCIRQLGYEPRVSLEEGLASTIDWYRSNSNTRELVRR